MSNSNDEKPFFAETQTVQNQNHINVPPIETLDTSEESNQSQKTSFSLTSSTSSIPSLPVFCRAAPILTGNNLCLLPEEIVKQSFNNFLHTIWETQKTPKHWEKNNVKLNAHETETTYSEFEKLLVENEQLENLKTEIKQKNQLVLELDQKNMLLQKELQYLRRKERSYLQEVQQIELKYQERRKSEEAALHDLHNLKDQLIRIEKEYENSKARCEVFLRENEDLCCEMNKLEQFNMQQKTRADVLEERGKSLQEAITRLSSSTLGLEKQLQSQREELETKYQAELKQVINKKQKEFEEQLKNQADKLQREASEREHLIANRGLKHVKLMNSKNELEVKLLQEKHQKESELYRMQLENAIKRIEKLESCLNEYKSKNTVTAAELHDSAERHCRKAIEKILLSTNMQEGVERKLKISSANSKEKQEKKKEPEDRVKIYIDFLLNETPINCNQLNELLGLNHAKSKFNPQRTDSKRSNQNPKTKSQKKPPWKA